MAGTWSSMIGRNAAFCGLLFSSGTVTETGTSAIIQLPFIPSRAWLHLIGTGITGSETCAVSIVTFHDETAAVSSTLHTFTTLDSGTSATRSVFPGQESSTYLTVANKNSATPIFPWWRIDYTLGGTPISLSFEIYAALI